MKNIIEIKDLKKSYKDVDAVKSISFSVKEGSLFAFLGENGAGKSTTINILCTVLQKDEGKITIAGYDLDKHPNEIKKIIGIVFQNSVLDNDLNVFENLYSRASYYGHSPKVIKEKINSVVQLLNLEEILKRKYKQLSGGQRRRVDIARALINQPKILFLDEPTTGLDPKTRKMVYEILNDLRRKTKLTIFLTTHYLEETKDADDVVIINDGEIVASGTPHQLKEKYSYNRLVWHAIKSSENDQFLLRNKLDFIYEVDCYKIKFSSINNIVDLIYQNKEKFVDFEIIKGDMDDVFLNVTGKKMRE